MQEVYGMARAYMAPLIEYSKNAGARYGDCASDFWYCQVRVASGLNIDVTGSHGYRSVGTKVTV